VVKNECKQGRRATASGCAQFCAHPRSRTIANGRIEARLQIAPTGAENQHHSRASHTILVVFGRSLNQRVPGSSPGRLTTSFQ